MAQNSIENGVAYSASQTQVQLASMQKPFVGIAKVEYKEADNIQYNYAIGSRRAVSVSYGEIRVEGMLSIHYEDFIRLVNTSPKGRLQDRVSENLIVTYNNPDKVVTHVVNFVIFTETPTSVSQGDMLLQVDIPFIAHSITYL